MGVLPSQLHSLPSVQVLVDGPVITFDVSAGRNASVTLGGNRQIDWINPVAGQRGILRVTQDGTGSRSIGGTLVGNGDAVGYEGGTQGPGYPLPESFALLDPGANSVTILEWYYDGLQLHIYRLSYDSRHLGP